MSKSLKEMLESRNNGFKRLVPEEIVRQEKVYEDPSKEGHILYGARIEKKKRI